MLVAGFRADSRSDSIFELMKNEIEIGRFFPIVFRGCLELDMSGSIQWPMHVRVSVAVLYRDDGKLRPDARKKEHRDVSSDGTDQRTNDRRTNG